MKTQKRDTQPDGNSETGSAAGFNRFLLYLLTGIVVILIPAVFSSSIIDPFLSARFLALALSLMVLTILLLFSRRFGGSNENDLHKRYFFLFAAVYLLAAYVSYLQCTNFAEWLFEAFRATLAMLFIYVSTVILLRNNQGFVFLSWAVTIGTFALCIIGLCQYYIPGFFIFPHCKQPSGLMGVQNVFSQYLLLSSPYVLYCIFRQAGKLNGRIFSALVLLLVLYNIIISTTRSVWTGIICASIVLWLTVYIVQRKKGLRSNPILPPRRFIYVGIAACAVIVIALLGNQVKISTTTTGRLKWWMSTVQMVADHPLQGVGAGNWKIVCPRYGIVPIRTLESESMLARVTIKPHNDFLWVVSETGIIGLIGYIGLLAMGITYSIKIMGKSNNPDQQIIARLMLFAMTAYLFIAFFSFPKDRIELIAMHGLILATVLSIYHRTFPLKVDKNKSSRTGILIIAVILSISASVFGIVRQNSENHLTRAINAWKGRQYDKVIWEIDLAYNPIYTVDTATIPLIWYKGMVHQERNNLPAAISYYHQALAANPNSVPVLIKLGISYGMDKQYDEAIKFFQKAIDIQPKYDNALFGLGKSYYHKGEFSKALDYFALADPEGDNELIYPYLEGIRKALIRKIEVTDSISETKKAE